jgi:electron transfer flavoprotein alpha subunit
MDPEGRLVQWKPAFGGNIVASIYSKTHPQMATIRPGALEMRLPRKDKIIPVHAWPPPKNAAHRFEIISTNPDAGIAAEKMDEAQAIVCIGAGLGQENDWESADAITTPSEFKNQTPLCPSIRTRMPRFLRFPTMVLSAIASN